jgi:Zn-dependent protease/predicted RNA-binding Zn-ribbon protein involved in translation (DUF1610 family)
MPTRQGSIRLFRFAGIEVFLHWSWFLIAAYMIQSGQGGYSSVWWDAGTYLALFAIVLMHEFGHALACRSVGGKADQIVLWPFGGVAYVDPPSRPGATLWSLAAGPLVNVALAPVLIGALLFSRSAGLLDSNHDLYEFIKQITYINLGLLCFNILPIYPLDGGQILWCLMWFVLGRARALVIATVIGFIGVAALVSFAIYIHAPWTIAICVFIFLNCSVGFRHGLALLRIARAPRRYGFTCPACGAAPPVGPHWRCGHCRQPFDPFDNLAICPNCGVHYDVTRCLECGRLSHIADWQGGHAPPPPVIH